MWNNLPFAAARLYAARAILLLGDSLAKASRESIEQIDTGRSFRYMEEYSPPAKSG
jgi:hypothetical protein